MVREAKAALQRERAGGGEAPGPDGRLPPAYFLAISGGGDDGAFGAGLLCGWSDSGTRPIFKLVTGVSTGAMIAPFAFLGRRYDDKLRAMFTRINSDDIYTERGLYGVLFGDSLADTTPLFRLISRYLDERMMADIAREYEKGRLLLIGTTNLDLQRPVIWNIGAIAASGRPGALQLIRKILLASAAMPGFFPPVMIDVEASGRHYQEMHVDGGAIAQTFLYPPEIGRLVDMKAGRYARERHAYIIRNGRLDPEWAATDRRFLSISGRAISTMIHYSGYNDILRIYATTQHDGVDYNLAYIGRDFPVTKHKDFDPAYLHALFDYGYAQGRSGYHWHKVPPILETRHARPASQLNRKVKRQADVLRSGSAGPAAGLAPPPTRPAKMARGSASQRRGAPARAACDQVGSPFPPSWPGLTRPSPQIPGSSPGMTRTGAIQLDRNMR